MKVSLLTLMHPKTIGRGRLSNCDIAYSWQRNKKANTAALVIRFSIAILNKSRYREGDKINIELDDSSLFFLLDKDNHFNLVGKNSIRQINISHMTAEKDLSHIFPVTGSISELEVVAINTALIECKRPGVKE